MPAFQLMSTAFANTSMYTCLLLTIYMYYNDKLRYIGPSYVADTLQYKHSNIKLYTEHYLAMNGSTI